MIKKLKLKKKYLRNKPPISCQSISHTNHWVKIKILIQRLKIEFSN